MKSEFQIFRYIKVLEKNASNLEAYNMIRALRWVLDDTKYPLERDLVVLEELHK